MRPVTLAVAVLIASLSPLGAQQTYTVNTVGDAVDVNNGDGVCDDGGGGCTLRGAIQEANATAGVDTIAFNIVGAGPHTIILGSNLPEITDPIVIDGYTEPGASVNTNPPTLGTNAVLTIVVDGTTVGDPVVVSAGNSTIRGLVLVGAGDQNITLQTNGGNTIAGNRILPSPGNTGVIVDSPNNTIGGTGAAARNVIGGGAVGIGIETAGTGTVIQGNLIGTDATGTAALPNTFAGINVAGPSTTIGGTSPGAGNVISGNGTGISIAFASADNTLIQGNLIGTDVTGTAPLGNQTDGVFMDEGTNQVVGGAAAGARNVISGNGTNGLRISDNADGVVVTGNFIGVDLTGSTAIPNAAAGITYTTSGHTIGGTTAGTANVISGNTGAGILIRGHTSVIQGNLIGTDATGTQPLGNEIGIDLQNGSSNTIGGPAAGAGNVIASSNQFGISITGLSPNNVVQGNLIGTDATGTLNLGNGLGSGESGVFIDAQDNTIERNTIVFSGHDGVQVAGGTGNRIAENVIHDNAGLGIDLGTSGVNANDGGDPDAGANNGQNFPLVLLAYQSNGTAVEGTLNSTPNTSFTIEFFSSGACDPTDHGEGAVFLGSSMATTGGGGDAGFAGTLATTVAAGAVVTATATDPGGNTSEFSPCVRVNAQPTFVVTASDDATDGVCSDGHCSLREAILAANVRPGTDTIHFDIPGMGPHVIAVGSDLPEITDPVVIDGYTQPGASPNTNPPTMGSNATVMVEIDVGANSLGLDISAGNSVVRGLAISDAGDWGIRLFTNGGNTLEGNFLGTNAAGNAAVPGNTAGVVRVESPNNLIGGTAPAARNVIAGGGNGITVDVGATGTVIQGNLIGTDAAGTSALGNQIRGVSVQASSATIGGTTAAAGNVIAGSGASGIEIGTGTGTVVQGNLIGTDVTGTVAVGNGANGVTISGDATNTLVGGTTAAARNILSGNVLNGVQLVETGVTDNLVQGNYIGTDITGTMAIPNTGRGVLLTGNSSANIIGGTAPGAGNLIAGNAQHGVDIIFSADANLIQGNLIGTDATGTVALPNNGDGIHIDDGVGNAIGGTASGAGNTIAFNGGNGVVVVMGAGNPTRGNTIHSNTGAGVVIVTGNGNAIQGNTLHSNTGIGIDLGPADGVTLNDVGDGDLGPNDLQNFPLVTLAYQSNGTAVEGTLNSTPNTAFTLEFFSSGTCDPTDHGEGQMLLGSFMAMTGGGGDAGFTATFPTMVAAGDVVTATATDPGGNTSEFSPCVTVGASPAFVVTTTTDGDDGVCSTNDCTLHEAIDAANARAGTDTIVFAIAGTGPHTIVLGGSLPIITDPVVIDGYSQPGASANTNPPELGSNAVFHIVVDAANAGGAGLDVEAGNSTIRGLQIDAAPDYAIGIQTNGGNLIAGNLLLPGPSADGVNVQTSNNTIGGTTPAARNVMGGGRNGVWITGGSDNVVQGNLIGTDASGTAPQGNQNTGVHVSGAATATLIGGTTAGARNVISGNGTYGILIEDLAVSNTVVQGNYIGTDVAGTTAMPNQGTGVRLVGSSSLTTIGGTASGAGNIISGNDGIGIDIDLNAHDNVVQGNLIGTDATGTAALPNALSGIRIGNAADNTIGGTASGAANTIAFNGAAGVVVVTGTGNAISGNAIHSNADIGIDLGAGDGVTPNDAGDGDAGPNNLQNFPTIAVALTGSAVLEGTVNSTPNTTLTLEFFASSACDASGNGEGERFLGTTMVTTDGSGDASFAVSLAGPASPGDAVTATATDGQGNTSEFSLCATGVGYGVTGSTAATAVRGQSATYDVTVTALGGIFDRDVALSCQGLPAGAGCVFVPNSVQPGADSATATLTVSTTEPTTPTGAHGFTIVGTHSSIVRTFAATLTVTDFTVAVAPASATAVRGGDATYTVTVNPDGGSFGQPVDLTCANLPAQATCTFAPAQVTPGTSPAMSTLTVSTADPDTPTGTVSFTVTGTSGALARSATSDLVVTDFMVAVTPNGAAARRGEAVTYTVTVNPDGGSFTDPVTLGCAGLPAQASCTFSPTSVTPGMSAATATLSVSTADPGTPVGSTTFTITGTSGTLQGSVDASITVMDFTLAVSPATVTVAGGASAALTVTVAPEGNAFNEVVALTCSALPSGASCSFSPGAVTPGTGSATSTLTLSATALHASERGPLVEGLRLHAGMPWKLPLALAALLAACGVLGRTRNRRRRLRAIAALALCGALAGLACGEEQIAGPSPRQPVTTTFTITGTSGSLTNSTTATVTVQ